MMIGIRKLALTSLTLASITICGVMLTVSPASALTRRNLLSSFGPGGPGIGTFANVQSIAVDQSSGSVYVFDDGSNGEASIYKFNTDGEPEEFTALKTNVIQKIPAAVFPTEAELAVDNSKGPASGDIYVTNKLNNVMIYGSDGSFLGELAAVDEGFLFPCGVAVDPAGNVYVGLAALGVIQMFTPTAKLVTSGDYMSSLVNAESVCSIAADGAGDVYSDQYGTGPVTRFSTSQFGEPSPKGVLIDEVGATLAVDPSTNDVYVDETDDVAQYDLAGNRVQTFAGAGDLGAVSESYGIAVYAPTATTSYVYLSGGVSGQVEIFSPGVVIPDITTGLVSGVRTGSATIEGIVNPDNTTLTSCEFEYGTSASYGSVAECESTPSLGNSPVLVTAKLSSLLPGTQYHYRLVAGNSNGSNQGADETFRAPAVVKGLPANNVNQFSATLNGTIDPGPSPASYHFAYGTSTAYESVAPIPDAYTPVGYAEDRVSEVVSGLVPDTTYHYALVSTDVGSTVTGPDETFTTPSVPSPVAGTGAATEVSRSGAVLSGTVDPMGWDTTYGFEYGTSTAYGSSWPTVDVDMGALVGPQPVLIGLQGLQPGTTYHYRLVATNPGGTSYGVDQTFTTGEYPVSLIQVAPVGAPLGIPPAKATKSKSKSKAKRPKRLRSKQKKRKVKKKR